MRALGLIVMVFSLAGCLGSDQDCATRPTDPMCQLTDGGPLADTGSDTGGDAHVACGGTCTGTMAHCLVSGTSETCVACLAEADCSGGRHCDTTSHACVECTTSTQCTDVGMSRCDPTAHTCGACTASTDCTHLTGTTVCDVAAGNCVACMTNTDCTATQGCDTSTNTCVTFTAASKSTCDTCVRDAECHAGQLCVPMTYDDPTTSATDPVAVGNHCLWRQDATGTGAPNGSCLDIRPYARASMLTSVDGMAAMACTLALSTCEAQSAFRMTDCMTLDATGDALCGVASVHDGICQMYDATHNRCSVFCGSDDDCRTGFTCDTSVTPTPVCHF